MSSVDKSINMTMETQIDLVTEFMKVLSLAHECIPETVKVKGEEKVVFQGPSPDEVTLVEFSKSLGFDFVEETDTYLKLIYTDPSSPGGGETGDQEEDVNQSSVLMKKPEEWKFELLRKIEFNSDRKRMSVLIRDPNDGRVKLYTKGADSIIFERLD